MGRVLQRITKVVKDLELEDDIVRQSESNIKNLNKKIMEAQISSTRLFDVSYTISAAPTKSATTIV